MATVAILLTGIVLLAMPGERVHAQQNEQNAVVLDENRWLAFYDVPSRRFRSIRSAILTQDLPTAERDLLVAAEFMLIEAERASKVLYDPLRDVVTRLESFSESVDTVTLEQVDTLFGRAHWLLAQHYLDYARQARDTRRNRDASLYLWATTHHMERALLWSNVSITREVHQTLEGLRDSANRIRQPDTAEAAYTEKPIVRAERLLLRLGEQMNRRVLLPTSPSR